MKIYPENKRNKEAGKWVYIIIIGLCIFIYYVVYGVAHKSNLFIASGFTVICLSFVTGILYIVRSLQMFVRSDGGVLEVLKDVVIAYHVQPFVYSKEELGEARLVPFPAHVGFVQRTLRLAVHGNVLSCTVGCSANSGRCQVVYDTFLRPDLPAREMATLESVVEASLDAFLYENRSNLTLLYSADEIPSDQRDEYVAETIKRKVEEYLKYELYVCGLTTGRVVVNCKLLPLIIE